jgi:hypothetical protein
LIDPVIASALRARFWAAAPFGVLLGLLIGVLLVRQGMLPVSGILLVVLGIPVASYVSLLLQAGVMTVAGVNTDSMVSDAIGLGFDAALGAAIGHFVAPALGVSALESVGVSSGILCFQTLIVEKVLVGNLFGEALLSLLFPSGSRDRPNCARAEALASLGNYDAAQQEFQRQIAKFPTDPFPRIRFAHMLRTGPRRYELAAEVLQQVLQMRRLDFANETAATRDLAELYVHGLRQPKRGVLILLKYSERHPNQTGAAWARRRLNDLAQALHKGGPVDPQGR